MRGKSDMVEPKRQAGSYCRGVMLPEGLSRVWAFMDHTSVRFGLGVRMCSLLRRMKAWCAVGRDKSGPLRNSRPPQATDPLPQIQSKQRGPKEIAIEQSHITGSYDTLIVCEGSGAAWIARAAGQRSARAAGSATSAARRRERDAPRARARTGRAQSSVRSAAPG